MAVTWITFKIRDGEDHTTNLRLPYSSTSVNEVGEAQGIATDLAPVLSGVINGKVVGAEVNFPLTVPVATEQTMFPASRNDAGATLSFANVYGRRWSLYVPTFRHTFLVAGVVNAEHENVVAFRGALVSGMGIDGGFEIIDPRGEDTIESFIKGFQSTRKNLRTR